MIDPHLTDILLDYGVFMIGMFTTPNPTFFPWSVGLCPGRCRIRVKSYQSATTTESHGLDQKVFVHPIVSV